MGSVEKHLKFNTQYLEMPQIQTSPFCRRCGELNASGTFQLLLLWKDKWFLSSTTIHLGFA